MVFGWFQTWSLYTFYDGVSNSHEVSMLRKISWIWSRGYCKIHQMNFNENVFRFKEVQNTKSDDLIVYLIEDVNKPTLRWSEMFK